MDKGCCNPSSSCGPKQPATCTFYDSELPEFSKYHGSDCPISVESLLSEIYKELDTIKKSIDLSKLTDKCVEFSSYKGSDNILSVYNAVVALRDKVCSDESNESSDTSGIDINKLDLRCVQDPCGRPIETPNQLLQLIINKVFCNG